MEGSFSPPNNFWQDPKTTFLPPYFLGTFGDALTFFLVVEIDIEIAIEIYIG